MEVGKRRAERRGRTVKAVRRAADTGKGGGVRIDEGPEGSMFRDSTGDALRPAAGVMALFYLCLGLPANLVLPTGTDRAVMVAAQIAAGLMCGAMWAGRCRSRGVVARMSTVALAAVLAFTVLAAALVTVAVFGRTWHTSNLMLFVVGVGGVVHTRWLAVTAAVCTVAGWLCLAFTVAPAALTADSAVGMVTALALAVVLHLSRTSSVARLEAARAAIRAMAVTDELTGLANRRGLQQAGEPLLELAARSGRPVTMLYVDVDGLKQVNDTRGHAAGDRLIVSVAATLSEVFRAADVVARTGGDEFAVLLVSCGPPDAAALVTRLDTRLDDLGAAASVGAAHLDGTDTVGLDDLMDRADRAMYAVKRGRAYPARR